jgi:hypothetical protein
MANLGQTFDANAVDPNVGFPLVPPGKYVVNIVDSDMRPTKDGNGQYLWLEMHIMAGLETGRRVYDRLNLINNNETTVKIAQQTLSQICHAIGIMSVSDSEQLHARRMVVDVRVEPGKGAYRDSNRIVAYHAADSQAAAATAKPPHADASRSAPPPWRRAS